jgi:cold shock CspA family protein
MNSAHFYGHNATDKQKRGKPARPAEPRWAPQTGRIVKLLVGQSCGFIRTASHLEVFFHRSDVHTGTSINDFTTGDLVAFELLDDTISGARARGVRRREPAGRPLAPPNIAISRNVPVRKIPLRR